MTEVKAPEQQTDPEPLLPPTPTSTEAKEIIDTIHTAPNPHTALIGLATPKSSTPDYYKYLEELGVEVDSGRFIVGDELIRPTAMLPDETDSRPSYDRGWLQGITSASRRKDIPEEERRKNVESITRAAIAYGLPLETLKEKLLRLGYSDLIAEFEPKKDDPEPTTTHKHENASGENRFFLKNVDLTSEYNLWRNVCENEPLFVPNQPDAIDAVRDTLSKDEKRLVFRMMSHEELQNAIDNGYVGGETTDGQVESGITWWGDSLRDSLNQRRGKIYTNSDGTQWGGSEGMLIALDRKSIQDKIVERRARPSSGKFAGYDAYKTTGRIPLGTTQDVYRVYKVRNPQEYDHGFFRIEKLELHFTLE